MSRLLKWVPVTATLIAGSFLACAVESPVAPTPDTPEDEVLEAQAEPSQRGPQPIEDEYIVIFRNDRQIPPGLVRRLVGDHDLVLKHEYEHVIHGFAAKIPPQALQGLRNNPFIERIEPNLEYTLETPARAAEPVAVPEDGLRVRLVADDLAPGDVAVWPNRGSEADAVQANTSRLPTYRGPSADFGGHASVGFNEAGDDDEALEIVDVSHHGTATVIAVLQQEEADKHHYGVAGFYGNSRSRAGFVSRFSRGNNAVEYWDSRSGWSGGTSVLSFTQTHVVSWRVDGETRRVDMAVDGVPAGSDNLKSSIPGFDRYVIGMTEPSTSTRFDGQIAEILFYDRALADCELDQIVADLGTQYAVSVSSTGGSCAPPADPTGLSATPTGSSTINVAWTDASTNEDGFRVERRLGQAGAWAQIAETNADATTYADLGLTAETEYCYRVQAFNAQGTSGWTAAACATTEAAAPLPPAVDVPTAGLRLRLIANDLPGGEVSTWPNRGSESDALQTDASRRPVYHAPSPTFGDNAAVGFNEGSDNDEALVVTGVGHHGSGTLIAVFSQDGTGNFNYGIFGAWGSGGSRAGMVTRAYSTGGRFDYWDSTHGWVNGASTVTPDLAYVGVWRVEAGQAVDLEINGEPAGSKGIGSGFPGFDRYVIGMTEPSTSTRFDGQIAEILFYDRALADCELDQIVADLGTQYAVSVSSAGGGCAPPAEPTGLAATPVGYDAIDLAWTDASTNEDGFRIERRLGQSGAWAQVATTAPDASSYESRNLIQQTEYCYRVSAFNADGSSGFSNVACATTEAAPPGACVDTGNHDDLTDLYGIAAIGAPANQVWASTQLPGCEITPWYFGLDSGIDSDHPDLNVIEAANFVAAEPNHDGEDGNGHGTHTAGTAAARDGNGGVVGVAPGARIHSFRVCEDGGSCQTADMVAAMDEVMARKIASPDQPMVANMSIGGPADNVIDQALRNSINGGIVYAVAAGNGILGACIFPNDAANVSPARVGDDDILPNGSSAGNDELLNGVLTTTSHDASFADVNCNYGAPVSVAAPGYQIRSTWLGGGYNTISGTSMATPHAAGAALLYLQSHPEATPAEVEAAIVSRLQPWTTNESPSASGRLSVDGL
ncbi:MAG TPA: S8 family serine peptidase [Gemmatimonadota bacterium]|nr:S8 family serine peptidase [Gemmatimonadota bacterium]